MVDCLPALCRGVAPALQKGDLPTQQVDGVPTPQQNGCPALPRGRQQCACSQVRADDWPDLHRCASVGCFLRLTSHIDFGIPARSRLHHHDLNDVRVPPQKSPSRLPARRSLSSSSPTVNGRLLLPYIRPRRQRCPSEGGANTPLPLTEEVVVVAVELGAVVVAEAAVVPQEEGALEKVQDKQARLLAVFRPAGVSDLSSSSHSRDNSTSRDSSSSRRHSSSSLGGPHCSGVRSSTWAPRRSGVREDLGASAAAVAVPAGPLAPLAVTLARVTSGASLDRAAPVSAAATTTLPRGASAASTTSTVPVGALRQPLCIGLAC
ncbi:unnamed protein product [Closterium sp. NIES-54]